MFGVITEQMETEIVISVHPLMHHEANIDHGSMSRLEGHRTDDRIGGSATLSDFDVRSFAENQGLVADVGESELRVDSLA